MQIGIPMPAWAMVLELDWAAQTSAGMRTGIASMLHMNTQPWMVWTVITRGGAHSVAAVLRGNFTHEYGEIGEQRSLMLHHTHTVPDFTTLPPSNQAQTEVPHCFYTYDIRKGATHDR